MSTSIQGRLDGLAVVATEGIRLQRPDVTPSRRSRHPRHRLALAVVVFVAVLAGLVWFAARVHDDVDTIDGPPTSTPTPTWPPQSSDSGAPTAMPRLVIALPGYTATSARESSSEPSSTTDPFIGARPRTARFFRRVDDPWALISISTFPALGDDVATQCAGSPLNGAAVSEACDLSGREPGFDIEADGIAVSVSGKNVTADAVRDFVDDLGGESVFGIDPTCCEVLPDGWSLVGTVGPGDLGRPPDTAVVSFDGPDGERVDLLQFSSPRSSRSASSSALVVTRCPSTRWASVSWRSRGLPPNPPQRSGWKGTASWPSSGVTSLAPTDCSN